MAAAPHTLFPCRPDPSSLTDQPRMPHKATRDFLLSNGLSRLDGAYTRLCGLLPGSPRPSAGLGPDDETGMLCWDIGRHHLEIEQVLSGDIEWFYRDREGDWGLGGELTSDSAFEEVAGILGGMCENPSARLK